MKILKVAKDLDTKVGSVIRAAGHIEGMIKDEIELREIDGVGEVEVLEIGRL